MEYNRTSWSGDGSAHSGSPLLAAQADKSPSQATLALSMARHSQVRACFPGLQQRFDGKPLAYLDSAATTQKPTVMLDAIVHAYREISANVHRGVHTLSERASKAYEDSRAAVATFLGATSSDEIVFVRGATEGINLVAHSFGSRFTAQDNVVVSAMEHHANLVPWQLLAQRQGCQLRILPILPDGNLDMAAWSRVVDQHTKLIAVTQLSNATGVCNPIADICARAGSIPVLVDGTQAACHMPIDVQALGCAFYVCSAHKMYGPTGIGAVWGKKAYWQDMPPFQAGGDMILSVELQQSTFQAPPFRFEAGTPAIAEAIAWRASLAFLQQLGMDAIARYEANLFAYAKERLNSVPKLRWLVDVPNQAGVLSFLLDGIHPHDIGTIVNQAGVAIRTGHHCAQPLMAAMGVRASARCSLGLYTTQEEIEQLIDALGDVQRLLGTT